MKEKSLHENHFAVFPDLIPAKLIIYFTDINYFSKIFKKK